MTLRCPKCAKELPDGVPSGASPTCPDCGSAFPHPQAPTLQYADGTPPLTAGPESAPTAASAREVLAAGTQVGPYRIEGLLGEGGMGAVYKAVQPGLDRAVALKILPAELARDRDFVARFNREARTLAALGHPNIIAVYDLGVAGDRYYFCMEFVDGQSLRQVLRARRLPQDEILAVLAQICDALSYAHAEGVVHRDIKPENVLLDRRGRVKVADFGLARLVRGEAPLEPLTRTNTVMGTVEYMAPEQRESARDVDRRVDLYSLGVMLYEMLTGKLPVGRWDLPSRECGCDARLDEVVLTCLEHDPRRRWSSAQEIAARLAAIGRAPGSGVASNLVLPHQVPSDAAPSVAVPAPLPGERQEVVTALAETLAPLGFQRHDRSLPPTVPLDAVFVRASPETCYLIAVAPWPAMQAATPDHLRTHAGLVRAGILGLLADREESEQRVLSVVFTGFPDELADDFAAALKRLVDRTGYHDLTLHSATAVDARAGKVHFHRSAFAFWGQRDVPEAIRAAARGACTAITRHRTASDFTTTRGARPESRLDQVEASLVQAGWQRVWWHESRPGVEVLARACMRPHGQEQAQIAVFRDLPAGRAPDRRWVQNQADLLRAAIHTLAPSLRWQEYLVSLCVGGAGPIDADGERALAKAINSVRLDAVSIQAVAYVPERRGRSFFQASVSPHYFGMNQTVEALRKALRDLPEREAGAEIVAPTVVPGRPAAALVPSPVPRGTEAALTRAETPAPLKSAPPGEPAVACPIGPREGIAAASFVDIVAESARYLWRHWPGLLKASLLIQFLGSLRYMEAFLGPLSNAYTMMVVRSLRERRPPRIADLTAGIERLPLVTLASWAIMLMFVLGLTCVFVPGLLVGTWFLFTLLLLADTKIGFVQAFRESRRLVTWRGFWTHLLIFLVQLAILAIGNRIAPDPLGLKGGVDLAAFLVGVLMTPLIEVPVAIAYVGARLAVPETPKALPQPDAAAKMPSAEAPTRVVVSRAEDDGASEKGASA